MPPSKRPHLLVLGSYLLLALLMTWPLARQLGSAIPGDSFDGWQNIWNLWWMRESWLVRQASPYLAPTLHFPTGADLRFQTMAPFNGLVTLPIQLGFGLLPAYNAAVLFSFVIGGFGAYLLALYALRGWSRQVGKEATKQGARIEHVPFTSSSSGAAWIIHSSAFIAGLIYAFSPYHFAHLLGHLQLIALQWIPFYILYLMRGLDRAARHKVQQGPSPGWMQGPPLRSVIGDGLKAGLFLVLVGLCDWYYVMYCLLFTALALLVWLIRRQLSWRGIGVVAVAGAFFGAALAPLLLPMVQAARTWPGASLVRDAGEMALFSADLLGFVTPQVFHPIWGEWAAERSAAFTATPSEYTVFAGFAVLALAGLALVAAAKPGRISRRMGQRMAERGRISQRMGQRMAERGRISRRMGQRMAERGRIPQRMGQRMAERGNAGRGSAAKPVYQSASTVAWFWVLCAAIFAVLALGPVLKIAGRSELLPGGGQIPLPYALLVDVLPFVKLSRSVSRFDALVMLCLGVAAAFGTAEVTRWAAGRALKRNANRRAVSAVAVAVPLLAAGLVLFEFLPAPYPVSPPDTPAWYAQLAADPSDEAVLNLPANYERPWYLLYQITHGKPLATGYVTRDDPRVLRERAPVLSHFRNLGLDVHTRDFDLAGQGMQVLHDLLGVGWVVLDRYKMPGGPERDVTTAYAQQIFTGQAPIYEDERLTVYRVTEPATRRPYVILAPGWMPRQSDAAGAVWRELPAGQPAGLEVVNPGGAPVELAIEVAAPAGGRLLLLNEAGQEVAAWPVGPESAALRLAPLAAAGDPTTAFQLRYEGPPASAAVLSAIRVEPGR